MLATADFEVAYMAFSTKAAADVAFASADGVLVQKEAQDMMDTLMFVPAETFVLESGIQSGHFIQLLTTQIKEDFEMKKLATLTVMMVLGACGLAQANGVDPTDVNAKAMAQALGSGKVVCRAGSDLVTLNVDKGGSLRMYAKVAGTITSPLDTDNERDGEECGGLSTTVDSQSSSYVLEDDYNDCERGDWGYQILIPQSALRTFTRGSGRFVTVGHTTDEGTPDDNTQNFVCTVE
jgi:hypothetical protein